MVTVCLKSVTLCSHCMHPSDFKRLYFSSSNRLHACTCSHILHKKTAKLHFVFFFNFVFNYDPEIEKGGLQLGYNRLITSKFCTKQIVSLKGSLQQPDSSPLPPTAVCQAKPLFLPLYMYEFWLIYIFFTSRYKYLLSVFWSVSFKTNFCKVYVLRYS